MSGPEKTSVHCAKKGVTANYGLDAYKLCEKGVLTWLSVSAHTRTVKIAGEGTRTTRTPA